jgi:hypothetical protein
MKIVISFLLVTIAALAAASAPAADAPGAACALLTQGELDEATGAKSGSANPTDQEVPAGQGQHLTMHACLWPVSSLQGQFALSVAPMPPGQSVQSIAKDNVGMNALRAQHYAEEAKDFDGNTTCSTMSPPASAKGGISISACTSAVRGKIVSVTYMSPGKKLSIEQTKALLDKAVARVH